MGHGEAWWFLRDDGIASLEAVVTALRDAGLVAGNPATGIPEMLDHDGKQVPWDAANVGRRWAAGEALTVQMWVNRETDVLIGLDRQHRLLTIDLDGMTTAEARLTVFAVLNAALSLAGTQAVIVDRDLEDYGEDLLTAVGGGFAKAALPFTPDLLVTADGDGHYRFIVRTGSWLSSEQ